MDSNKEEPTVLMVVDDEQEILSSIKSLFRRVIAAQHFFQSPIEAVKFMQNNKIDIIIADSKMPELSGKDFLLKAKNLQPDALKIILSAHENKDDILDTLARGLASYYIFKPWDDFEFVKLIEKYTSYYEKDEYAELTRYISSFSGLKMSDSNEGVLIDIVSREDVNINKLCQEIEKNPFLAAKLIQVSNSVSFSAYRTITTTRDAVIFIGIRHMKNLLLSLKVLKKFTDIIHPVYHGTLNEYWERTNKRVKITRQIASIWPVKVDTDLLFITTVLSDIGELFFLYTQAEKYKQFVEFAQTINISRIEAEKKFFIYSHTQLGKLLLNIWNFPEAIINIVENHHIKNPEDELIKIIQLCDEIDEQRLNLQPNFNLSDYINNIDRVNA